MADSKSKPRKKPGTDRAGVNHDRLKDSIARAAVEDSDADEDGGEARRDRRRALVEDGTVDRLFRDARLTRTKDKHSRDTARQRTEKLTQKIEGALRKITKVAHKDYFDPDTGKFEQRHLHRAAQRLRTEMENGKHDEIRGLIEDGNTKRRGRPPKSRSDDNEKRLYGVKTLEAYGKELLRTWTLAACQSAIKEEEDPHGLYADKPDPRKLYREEKKSRENRNPNHAH